MAAQVVAVAVAAGDRVEPGGALVTLRAMKLEHRVVAQRGALVREVLVREGDLEKARLALAGAGHDVRSSQPSSGRESG